MKNVFFIMFAISMALISVASEGIAQEKKVPPEPPPTPTEAEVAYGTHPKQMLSFWKVESKKLTPLLFFIHGGGWQAGNHMGGMNSLVPAMHKAGISVVSIEYRFIEEAIADNVEPPVKGCLHDAARALQFVRSKATEWNIDKTRIAVLREMKCAC